MHVEAEFSNLSVVSTDPTNGTRRWFRFLPEWNSPVSFGSKILSGDFYWSFPATVTCTTEILYYLEFHELFQSHSLGRTYQNSQMAPYQSADSKIFSWDSLWALLIPLWGIVDCGVHAQDLSWILVSQSKIIDVKGLCATDGSISQKQTNLCPFVLAKLR